MDQEGISEVPWGTQVQNLPVLLIGLKDKIFQLLIVPVVASVRSRKSAAECPRGV
jgi:hypothetical protein